MEGWWEGGGKETGCLDRTEKPRKHAGNAGCGQAELSAGNESFMISTTAMDTLEPMRLSPSIIVGITCEDTRPRRLVTVATGSIAATIIP